MVPKTGQNLLLNNRLWTIRQAHLLGSRHLDFVVIGASAAAQGMTRRLAAIRYDDDLFIEQRHQGYWYGHLGQDWVEDERGPGLVCRPATWLDLLDAHTRHPAAGDLKNEFSWSYSRAAKYQQCPRAYYYHYYAAWEGWQPNAPAPVQRAYLLKNLTDLGRWTGSLVHEAIKFALARLRAGQPVVEADLVRQMRARAQADFADSRSGRYRRRPNQLTGFQEHYYQTDLPQTAWQSAWADIEYYIRLFLNSDLYARLGRQPPESFLELETLQAFNLAETKVWVQMDLAQQEDHIIYIYDWKTRRSVEDELRQQLGIYGLYLRQTRPQIAALQGMVYDLAADKLLEFDLDDAALQSTETTIAASIAHLRGLLLDPVINLAGLDRFPMIDDLAVCRLCQFRELCGRDKT